jgi:HD-GYP domain-containing protein (c-di-GMP phosphodiesterase class II)
MESVRVGRKDRAVREERYQRPDQQEVWARRYLSRIKGSRPVLLEYQAHDITERRRAEARAARRMARLETLRRIDNTVTTGLDPAQGLQTVVREVTSALEVDAASVLLTDAGAGCLVCSAAEGIDAEPREVRDTGADGDPAERAARERETVHIPDLDRCPEDRAALERRFSGRRFRFYCAVPLVSKGQVEGVLEILHGQQCKTSEEWFRFLDTLAGQTAIVIHHASVLLDLQRTNRELLLAYDRTIEGWSRAMEIRDRETEGHTQRVARATVRLARSLGIGPEQEVHIRRGALLHDIGKLGVPDRILLKPGPLTEDERAAIEHHPVLAYKLLAPIEYLRPALDIPYCHHEAWDGTGYPRGISGTDIPPCARIFAVVDVWDALRSDRPYRPAWSEDDARNHIRSERGGQFDPNIVDAFLAAERDGLMEGRPSAS